MGPSQEVRVIGRYAMYGPIASGGMATVHYGRLLGAVGFSRTVAIKRLHPQYASDPEFVRMFLDEARLAARIRHPHVVPTLDIVATEGELFVVMEYVAGESLQRLARAARERGGQVPIPIASAIVGGVLQGLHAAHEARNERGEPLGIVHRDVSPQNVLVGTDGQARLLDFGVAKAEGRAQTTRDGAIKGKIAYMAPEQIRGEPVDRRTDVFAASILMWELLTGERLFKADNEAAVVLKIIDKRMRAPSAECAGRRAEEVAAYDALLRKGLAYESKDRFATAREMLTALEAIGPVATAAQVGEWVEGLAHDVLASRAIAIAVIESTDPAARRTASGEVPAALRGPSNEAMTDIAPSSQSSSSVSILSTKYAPFDTRTRRRRGIVLGATAVLPLLLVLGLLAAFRGGSGQPETPVTPSSSPPPAEPSPPPVLAPSPPASTSALPPEPDPSLTPAPSVAPVPAPAPSVAPAPIHPHPPPAPAPPRADCNPPYTYDAKGLKHFKPNCL